MERSELLDYVRALRSRQRESDNRVGFNLWALCAAFFALVWNTAPRLSDYMNDSKPDYLMLSIGIIAPIVISFFSLIGFFDLKPSEKYREYRVKRGYSYSNPFVHLVLLFLGIIFPLIAAIESKWFGDVLGFFEIVRWFNIALLSAFVFTSIYSIYVRFTYIRKYGLPPFSDMHVGSSSEFNKIVTRFMLMWVSLVFLGNIWVVFYVVGKEVISIEDLVLSFNIIAIIIVSMMIVSKIGETSEGSRLERLERDIVMGDVSDEQIKERLEEEYIGVEVSQLLSQKISEVEYLAQKLVDKSVQYEDFKKELLEIDPKYKYEIVSRFEDFWEKYLEIAEDYSSEVSKLVSWFDKIKVNITLQADDPVKDLVSENVHRVKEKHEEIRELILSMRHQRQEFMEQHIDKRLQNS